MMDYIRKTYGVKAKRGGRIEYTNGHGEVCPGKIIGSDGAMLKIRLDGAKFAGFFHPTYNLRYLD